MAGWASNSKYAFLGALRSAAQMVSYEVSIGFVIVSVLLCVGSLNSERRRRGAAARSGSRCRCCRCSWCSSSPAWPRPTARPSTCRKAKCELVGGFFVEYSAMTFALFYLGEYANMILMSAMTSILFLGGWLPPVRRGALHLDSRSDLVLRQDGLVLFCFLWVRATFPRFRYDQLMRLGWKVFLPLSLFWLVLTAGVLIAFGWLPGSARAEEVIMAIARPLRALPAPVRAGLGHVADLQVHVQGAGDGELSLSRRGRSARASAASTRCAAIPTARSAASPASCARRSARRWPSPSRPSRARTAAGARPATTST